MKWRCELFQRWLPEYLDGELVGFRRRWLAAHLQGCPECRRELVETAEVLAALKAQPVLQPGEAFWQGFDRELHLKLVQAQQKEAPRSAAKWFSLMAAPAMAGLLLVALGYLNQVQKPVLPLVGQAEQVVYAGLDDGLWQGEEFPSWDIQAVLADLSDQERELVLKKVGY